MNQPAQTMELNDGKSILLYKVVQFFVCSLRLTFESTAFFILWKLYVGPGMVLGYLFLNKSKLYFTNTLPSVNLIYLYIY